MEGQNLTIMTWNATGIFSSASYLSDTLVKYDIDICGISEHWLHDYNLYFMKHLNSVYNYHAVSDFDLSCPLAKKAGKGGVAILWHKRLDNMITPLPIEDDHIIGIQFQVHPQLYVFIFQVYLPCTNHSISVFTEYIDKLYNLWYMYSEIGVPIFIGDFNANLLKTRVDSRVQYLKNFLRDTHCTAVNTLPICRGAKNSFVSYDGCHSSMIDYVCLPNDYIDCVSECVILDDNSLNVSRHRPICLTLLLPGPISGINPSVTHKRQFIWSKISENDKLMYLYELTECLKSRNVTCCPLNSTDDIDSTYNDLTAAILDTSVNLPTYSFKPHLKPYWSHELKSHHKAMVDKRKVWCSEGRPRGISAKSYCEYKAAKCAFRRIHRQQVSLFLSKLDNDIEQTADVDSKLFWKLVNARRKQKSSAGPGIKFGNTIFRDQRELTEQWALYFKDLYAPSCSPNYDEE